MLYRGRSTWHHAVRHSAVRADLTLPKIISTNSTRIEFFMRFRVSSSLDLMTKSSGALLVQAFRFWKVEILVNALSAMKVEDMSRHFHLIPVKFKEL